MADSSSDDSDEWGTEEIVIPSKSGAAQNQSEEGENDDGDWDWDVVIEKKGPKLSTVQTAPKKPGEPMIIVDITQLDENVHSKFDRNSVNNTDAASAWRKKIENQYQTYSKDAKLLGNGTVIPCGSSVWRDALVRLRDERKGHYFCPVFSPKK
ncbi:unnamed protein product [Cylindrotheca closterium]|uniref:Uncharacterized protein n=1 Tax=Cylindrotheca closterium TaxID=2856 RepID=A0AAD2JP63_9STRA|nr:unnamed protein product [Cylindrotheca closterium]